MFGQRYPHLFAVCEITREAAQELAARLRGDYRVTLPPSRLREDDFHVAVFYRSGSGFTPEDPIIPSESEDVTDRTRVMIPVHFTISGHVIRFVACHWTAYDHYSSHDARERQADVLRRNSHEFLVPAVPNPRLTRHLVILGDLNEEPTADIFRIRLIGRRDRASSHQKHWRDRQFRRIRLYNAAWRYLGEQVAHGTAPQPVGAAGTLYNDSDDVDAKGWWTFDHLLVSAGLLGQTPPYLDEARTGIVFTPLMRDASGLPRPFTPGSRHGVSDHLPIVGRLVLPEPSK
jgi:endonuclease/exonuclease/phosphatase family metal-dependent hydrolase